MKHYRAITIYLFLRITGMNVIEASYVTRNLIGDNR